MFSPVNNPTTGAPLLDRRRFLGTLGLAGLGMLASSAGASALTTRSGIQTTPNVSIPTSFRPPAQTLMQAYSLPDLPEQWLETQGPMVSAYLRYLNSLHLQFIKPAQVIESHAKQKANIWNTLPPKVWWNRMGYTLKVVDRIAKEMNVNHVEVISAYRCPPYNAHCSGAKSGSWHQANVAADVKFPVKASQVTATARELRNLGLFRGGVGGYWDFTHIDARGVNVDWHG